MTPFALREYKRLRKLGWQAQLAYRYAIAYDNFTDLENAGLARLNVEPDMSPDMSWADQDCFKHDRAKIYERAERDGICGIVAQVRASDDGEWETVDSCWGFIGDDWRDSGYDFDHYAACVDWHDKRAEDAARAMEAARPDMYDTQGA